MKKIIIFLSFVVLFTLFSCSKEQTYQLATPNVLMSEKGVLTWNDIDNALGYAVSLSTGEVIQVNELSYELTNGTSARVKALGDNKIYYDSEYSEMFTYFIESYTLTFMADGNLVSRVYYLKGETNISEPDVPLKSGYFGYWEEYSINNTSMVINAKYAKILDAPVVVIDEKGNMKWAEVENASSYRVYIGETYTEISTNSYVLEKGKSARVKAISNDPNYYESDFSNMVSFYQSHTATFVADGKIIKEVEFYEGVKSLKEPDVPKKSGYTGVWEAYTIGEENITINAIYTLDPNSLISPVVTLIYEENKISWESVPNADRYGIIVNNLEEVYTTNLEYNVTSGSVIKVRAISNSGKENSDYTTIKYYLQQTYKLTYAYSDFYEEEVTSDYNAYQISLFYDGSMEVLISKSGRINRRYSTYEYTSLKLKETADDETYTYLFQDDKLLITIEEGFDTINYTFTLVSDNPTDSAVDFESVLFGPELTEEKIYNYCPAIIYETIDDTEIMHIWYCCNKDSGVIMDYIGYRKGVKQENGKWLFSEETIVIEPTEDTWDARHCCDPAVVKGEFNYKGTTYAYLMAYLGCTTEDYSKNETGIAVANDPIGPWIKINEVNPIVPWYDNGNEESEEIKAENKKNAGSFYWGTGMPALLSVDEKGEVILFNQSTLNGTTIRRIDLSDVSNPIVKYISSINSNGLKNSNNANTDVRIADFAYDPITKRLYVCSVTNEKNPKDVTLTRVNSHSCVAYIENLEDMEAVSEALRTRDYTWIMVGYVGPNETGWERNHNPGIVRNNYGYIPNSNEINVVVSTGHNSWANENIFTYRLYGHKFKLEENE